MSGQLDHGYQNADGDFGEHLKTYKAFLNLVTFSTVATVVTLLLLYFFLAR
ncbi:MAG: aa3-type cytochrome c oxidase subunit IV [Methylocystis sp.]